MLVVSPAEVSPWRWMLPAGVGIPEAHAGKKSNWPQQGKPASSPSQPSRNSTSNQQSSSQKSTTQQSPSTGSSSSSKTQQPANTGPSSSSSKTQQPSSSDSKSSSQQSSKTSQTPSSSTTGKSSGEKSSSKSSKAPQDDDDDEPKSQASSTSSAKSAQDSPSKEQSASAKSGDDEESNAKAESKRSRDSNTSSATQASTGPIIPETVAELFGRVFSQPSQPTTAPVTEQKPIIGGAADNVKEKVKPALVAGPTADSTRAGLMTAAKAIRLGPAVSKRALALEPLNLKGGELLATNLSPEARQQAISRGFQVGGAHSLSTLGSLVTTLNFPPGMSAAEARGELRKIAPDASVGVNQRYNLHPAANEIDEKAAAEASEPARDIGGCVSERCYGAAAIGWKAHLARCARNTRIGVIDTGIDITHPALKGHDVTVGRIGPPATTEMHGTGVLGLLAGDARSTTPGLIPGAKFFVMDIFFPDEKGQPVSTTVHLLQALDWMAHVNVDIDIINLSLSGPRDPLVHQAIEALSKPRKTPGGGGLRRGIIFVAAAGNGGPGAPPSYPAAYADVVAVTAVSKDLRSYRQANHGDYIDVAAPGVNIWTAFPDGRQGYQSGTSFAAPYMTAVIAAAYKGVSNTRTKDELLQHISTRDLGAPGRDRIYGRGLVQAPTDCEAAPARTRSLTAPWTTTHRPTRVPPQDQWTVSVARSPSR